MASDAGEITRAPAPKPSSQLEAPSRSTPGASAEAAVRQLGDLLRLVPDAAADVGREARVELELRSAPAGPRTRPSSCRTGRRADRAFCGTCRRSPRAARCARPRTCGTRRTRAPTRSGTRRPGRARGGRAARVYDFARLLLRREVAHLDDPPIARGVEQPARDVDQPAGFLARARPPLRRDHLRQRREELAHARVERALDLCERGAAARRPAASPTALRRASG